MPCREGRKGKEGEKGSETQTQKTQKNVLATRCAEPQECDQSYTMKASELCPACMAKIDTKKPVQTAGEKAA